MGKKLMVDFIFKFIYMYIKIKIKLFTGLVVQNKDHFMLVKTINQSIILKDRSCLSFLQMPF